MQPLRLIMMSSPPVCCCVLLLCVCVFVCCCVLLLCVVVVVVVGGGGGGCCWLWLVGCCCCCWTRAERDECVCSQAWEPSMAKNSSPSKAPKNWRSTPGQPRGARKMTKRPKKTSNRLAAINTAIQLVAIMSRFPVRTCAWTSE